MILAFLALEFQGHALKIRHLEAIKKSWNSRVRRYWVTTFLAFKGLKYVSINMKVVGTGLNPKTNVCLDPTLTVCFQYYRLGPECMVHGGHLPGV